MRVIANGYGPSGDIVLSNFFGVATYYGPFTYSGDPEKISLCPPMASASLVSSLTGIKYQWQLSTDSIHFADINNNSNYTGVTTSTLQLNNISSSWYGYRYQCIVDDYHTSHYTLIFNDTLTGGTGLWENAASWSCGKVPDANTDVVVNTGNVTINSDVIIRSLHVAPGYKVTVSPGKHLTITH